jgi:rhodanese-related sulfurtransferase/rubrerythrin
MSISDSLSPVPTITPDNVRAELERPGSVTTLLDVREVAEYEAFHIPGAFLIPLSELLDRAGEIEPGRRVVTYCKRGKRSHAAAVMLLQSGVSDVASMEGGIEAWRGAQATGSYQKGLSLVDERRTLPELAALGWAFEDGARRFYERLMSLCPQEGIQAVLRALCRAEYHHKEIILKAYGRITGAEGIPAEPVLEGELADIMEGGMSVDTAIEEIKSMGAAPDDIIEYAMGAEANALDLYIKLYHRVGDPQAQELLREIIDDEKAHLKMLGRLMNMLMDRTEP